MMRGAAAATVLLFLGLGPVSLELPPDDGDSGPAQSSAACHLVRAVVTGFLEGPAKDPMHLPSHVLPLSDGRIVVLDGTNRRLAFFRADGTFEMYVSVGEDEGRAHHPSLYGMCGGPSGEIIVSNPEEEELLVLSASGALIKRADLGKPLPQRSRISGAASARANRKLYLTDTRNHAVHALTYPGLSLLETIPLDTGAAPEGGMPSYPCSPLCAGGGLYVVEPLNGRVRRIDLVTGDVRFMSGYGIAPGFLYRPKGLALDKGGHLFVSDCRTGAVSVFGSGEEFTGLLGGDAHLRFASPCGLAFGRDGGLFVVEMARHRVTRLDVNTPDDVSAAVKTGEEEAPGSENGDNARACTICHPERIPSKNPLIPAEQAPGIKSTRATCLSCHDGVPADSRSTAFALHSHASGAKISHGRPGAHDLPAGPQGSMTCMTCHQAHGSGDRDYFMESAVFLRLPGPEGGICLFCHDELDPEEGPAAAGGRSHFMGAMGRALPETLVHEGAALPTGAEAKVSCRTCHLPHGQGKTRLLVGGALGPCRICHENVPHLNEPHARSGSFSCLECHRAHGSTKGALLGERPGGDKRRCVTCHQGKERISGSAHDTKEGGEVCSSCHSMYGGKGSKPVMWKLGAGDGQTTSEKRCGFCHGKGSGSLPESTHARQLLHPGGKVPVRTEGSGTLLIWSDLTCGTCHDPHAGDSAFLKRDTPRKTCALCHGPAGLSLFLNYH